MSILDKFRYLFFRKNEDNSSFDLNELKENIRKYKERESAQRNSTLIISDSPRKTDTKNSEIIREVQVKPDPLITYGRRQKTSSKPSNPLLLGAKMFLADHIYLINKKYEKEKHECRHFAKEVQDSASQYGIRCGYVVINFKNNPIRHAIVAFETDYGLKFFEPQNADEQDVFIGQRYAATSSGFSEENVISKVEIFWNDGTHSEIE